MDKKKILIIDDEEGFSQLIKMNLEESGEYDVYTQSKGLLGLATAKQVKPNLIFLDILMPDVEGSEVAAQLRDDRETKNIPVVFLTALVSGSEVKSRGGTIAGNPFIAKPASADQLIAIIKKTIG